MATNLTRRGPNANAPARMPSLQASRIADPNIRQAVDALREWVEIRLGSRGDDFERVVTHREYDPQVAELLARLRAIDEILLPLAGTTSAGSAASGDLSSLRSQLQAAIVDYQAKDTAIRAQATATAAALDSGLEILRRMILDLDASVDSDIVQLRALIGTPAPVAASGVLLSDVNVWTANQSVQEVTLVDGATVTIDAALGNNFELTLGGNRTLANPTNLTKGMVVNLVLRQDATGSRTVTWGTTWDFGLAGAPVLSTGANKVDFISAYYNATAGKLLAAFRKSA